MVLPQGCQYFLCHFRVVASFQGPDLHDEGGGLDCPPICWSVSRRLRQGRSFEHGRYACFSCGISLGMGWPISSRTAKACFQYIPPPYKRPSSRYGLQNCLTNRLRCTHRQEDRTRPERFVKGQRRRMQPAGLVVDFGEEGRVRFVEPLVSIGVIHADAHVDEPHHRAVEGC